MIYRKDSFVRKAMLTLTLLLTLMVVVFAVASPSSANTITGNRTTVLNISLVEYSGYRSGTLYLYYITKSNPTPPYGYPYEIYASVNSVCSATAFITGGTIDSWLYWVYSASDLYSYGIYDYALALVAPFGSDYGYGSYATYYPCSGGPFNVTEGALYLLFYNSSYYDGYGNYVVGDLIVCDNSNGYNCNYYYMYSSVKLF